jgi:hypothetical protein
MQFRVDWQGFPDDQRQWLGRAWANFAFPDVLCCRYSGRVVKTGSDSASFEVNSTGIVPARRFSINIDYSSAMSLVSQFQAFVQDVGLKTRGIG